MWWVIFCILVLLELSDITSKLREILERMDKL